jgi:hypothetical protein
MTRKPNVSSRRAIGCGEPPHSGHAMMYSAAAAVKRTRQRGQQRWVVSRITARSFPAGRARTLGTPGS